MHFILGGTKSGKSRFAEQCAETYAATNSAHAVTVIATARAGDAEMQTRILRHKQQRPKHWMVVEEPIALGAALEALNEAATPCVLIDCLTLWLTQLLDESISEQQRTDELQAFLDSVDVFQGELIVVSNETNMGITPLCTITRQFVDQCGVLHQTLGARANKVTLMVAGLPLSVK